MGVSQSEFGQQLGASAMSVSRWEHGQGEPPGRIYAELGNMAGDPECWYFWERAGIRPAEVSRAAAAAKLRHSEQSLDHLAKADTERIAHAGAGCKAVRKHSQIAKVPLLPVYAATPGSQGDNEADLTARQPERILPLPAEWCPHPEATVCMRVKGDSMSPLILDDYIIAVDTMEVERDSLLGEIVVARHIDRGLLVSRLIRFGHMDALVSDHREYNSVSLATSEWRIVGKVVWWAGRPKRLEHST